MPLTVCRCTDDRVMVERRLGCGRHGGRAPDRPGQPSRHPGRQPEGAREMPGSLLPFARSLPRDEVDVHELRRRRGDFGLQPSFDGRAGQHLDAVGRRGGAVEGTKFGPPAQILFGPIRFDHGYDGAADHRHICALTGVQSVSHQTCRTCGHRLNVTGVRQGTQHHPLTEFAPEENSIEIAAHVVDVREGALDHRRSGCLTVPGGRRPQRQSDRCRESAHPVTVDVRPAG